jgi:hypothetical protein
MIIRTTPQLGIGPMILVAALVLLVGLVCTVVLGGGAIDATNSSVGIPHTHFRSAEKLTTRCKITQYTDIPTPEYQLERKISCFLLENSQRSRYEYVYTPLVDDAAGLETQFNLRDGIETSQFALYPINVVINGDSLRNFTALMSESDVYCNEKKEFVLDNCWGLFYEGITPIVFDSTVDLLRKQYMLTPKPPVESGDRCMNVVVYANRQDFPYESEEHFEAFVDQAIRHILVQHRTHRLCVFLDGDAFDLQLWLVRRYANSIQLRHAATKLRDNFITHFHRLATAEALIITVSPLTIAALLYSVCRTVIIPAVPANVTHEIYGPHAKFLLVQPRIFHLNIASNLTAPLRYPKLPNPSTSVVVKAPKVAPINRRFPEYICLKHTDSAQPVPLERQFEVTVSCALLTRMPLPNINHYYNYTVDGISSSGLKEVLNIGDVTRCANQHDIHDQILRRRMWRPTTKSVMTDMFVDDCWEELHNATVAVKNKPATTKAMQNATDWMRGWYRSSALVLKREGAAFDYNMVNVVVYVPSHVDLVALPSLAKVHEGQQTVDLFKVLVFLEFGIRYFLDRYGLETFTVRVHLVLETPTRSPSGDNLGAITGPQQDLLVKSLRKVFGNFLRIVINETTVFGDRLDRLVGADGLVLLPNAFYVASSLLSEAHRIVIPTGNYGRHANYLDNQYFEESHNTALRFVAFDVADVASSVARITSQSASQADIGSSADDETQFDHTSKAGWANGRLVHLTDKRKYAHPRAAVPCLITQFGFDGFGHQFEGKLSCILLAELWPSRFQFMYSNFSIFEHIKTDANVTNYIENFTNLAGLGYKRVDTARFTSGKWRFNPAYRNKALEERMAGMLNPDPHCNTQEPMMVDNCWQLAYREPVITRLNNVLDEDRNRILSKLRQNYLQTPKPATGFERDQEDPTRVTRNVVVHVRHGDSGDRFAIDEKKYFESGMQYYVDRFTVAGNESVSVKFWIETDSPKWEVYQHIITKYAGMVVPTNPEESVFTVFHRMVMADGIVMSPSSLSNAAAMLSAAEVLVISNTFHGLHAQWMNSTRFVIIE